LKTVTNETSFELLTPQEINTAIKKSIEKTGDFNWKNAEDLMLWSAVIHGDSILTVGYGSKEFIEGTDKLNSDLRKSLIDEIILSEGNAEKTNIVIHQDEFLTYFDIKVSKIETIALLRSNPNVRYAEPSGYRFFDYEATEKSDSGCDTGSDVINTADYRLIAPNCYVSWVYDKHNIPSAWNISTGRGITVGVVDTGISPYQSLLNASFNDGYSTGRTVQKYGTYTESIWYWVTTTDGPDDKCSHGTSMSSNVASPRNDNYMPVGVAYNCNLISYRGTSDVLLDDYHEQRGVADAITALANRSDLKIISMSVGYIFTISKISDAVKYAYSKGKLIFAAGGTSTSFTNFVGVIFPASMAECNAVTGVTDGGSTDACDVCHWGSQIDFTVVMQRYYDGNRTSPTTGFYENSKQYVGGSSIATSTMAGIAALVWAKYPTWTRDQVLTKLIQSSEFYPYKNADFGYGSVDAYKAVL
jgi:subtilisin family serine protease